jgi:PAS domain-containing protein
MKQKLSPADDLLTALAYQRQSLLKHVATVLSTGDEASERRASDREAQLSAITVSSLEELKVAEEELTERTAALADLRDALESRLQAAHQLFELAPACLLVTDVYGNILHANRAMRRLLRVDPKAMDRQPLARFISHDARRGFRDGLTRIAQMDGVSEWRMVLVRPTDAPVEVSAVVDVLRSAETPSGTTLYWWFTTVGEGTPSASPNEA